MDAEDCYIFIFEYGSRFVHERCGHRRVNLDGIQRHGVAMDGMLSDQRVLHYRRIKGTNRQRNVRRVAR